MEYFKVILWCFLLFISAEAKKLRKIFMVDYAEDPVLLKNYDDYDLVNEFGTDGDYKEWNRNENFYKQIHGTHVDKLNEGLHKKKKKKLMCQRLFGSMYGNLEQQSKCLQSVRNNQRSLNLIYYKKPRHFGKLRYYISPLMQKRQLYPTPILNKRNDHDDINIDRRDDPDVFNRDTRDFSQDYLDVKDLGRSGTRQNYLGRSFGFSSDYLDVDDIRTLVLPDCYTLFIDEFGQILKTKC